MRAIIPRLCFLLVLAAACNAPVQTGLDESEANQLVVVLRSHGIEAQKEEAGRRNEAGKFRVVTNSSELSRALAVLRAANLPRPDEAGFEEVFGEGGLVPTAAEERARYAAALSGELARSIETMEGVLDARVHVALEETPRTLDGPAPAARASVLVKRLEGSALDLDGLRRLVAGAVAGMAEENVAVVVTSATPPPTTTPPMTHVGPLVVAESTAPLLKTVLGVSFLSNLALAGLVFFVVLRRRRPESS